MKNTILVVVLLASRIAYSGDPVYIAESIPIGGIQQFITVEGKDSSLPVLLFLHGGPGGSMMEYSHKFTNELQQHFLVVHWDQRETGRTLQLNPSAEPLTFSLFQRDTRELVEYLLKRFGWRKLYLAAHSWGTALGFSVVRDYPHLFYAYMAIGPMVHQTESERISLKLMRDRALAAGDALQSRDLASITIPFANGPQLYFHRKWLQTYSGSKRKLSRSCVEEWAARWLAVFNEASGHNLCEELPEIACPVYFFLGRRDLQTNAALAEQYYQTLAAPRKAFFWFEHSAHAVPTTEPERLQKLIIETVLPETFTLQKPEPVIGTR